MAEGLGSRIGPRVADIVTRAKLDSLSRSTGLFVKTGMAMQEEFFRLTGVEMASTIGRLYQTIADQADDSSWVGPTFKFLAEGRGQFATVLGITGISSGMGQGIGALIANDLNPIITEIIARTPYSRLTVADAAAAAAHGLADLTYLAGEAAGQGIERPRFEILAALAQQTHSPVDVLDLINRGVFNEAAGLAALNRSGVNHDVAQNLLRLRHQLLSVQDLAAMENRGIVTVAQGRALAGLTGWSADDFDKFDLLAGEPPDLTTTILAWQRGIITEADVDRAILQGPLRREWIPVAKNLRWVPLSAEVAADAVNQGHMSLADAQQVAKENGLKPELFSVIINNAGIPPGPQEALEWLNRGLITEAEFETAFFESRIKNKYVPLYLKSRHRLLTLAEVRLLYRDGAMTKAQAIERLQLLGFSPDNASIVVNGASAQRTAKARDLTRDQVISLYKDRIITRDDALAMLGAMGWDDQESAWIIDLADMARIQTFINAAISRTRSQYVAHKIDANEASAAMDALSIAPDARDSYLALWDIERGVVTKELTSAEIITAAKRSIITVDDARARLIGQGYSPDDADIKLAINGLVPA